MPLGTGTTGAKPPLDRPHAARRRCSAQPRVGPERQRCWARRTPRWRDGDKETALACRESSRSACTERADTVEGRCPDLHHFAQSGCFKPCVLLERALTGCSRRAERPRGGWRPGASITLGLLCVPAARSCPSSGRAGPGWRTVRRRAPSVGHLDGHPDVSEIGPLHRVTSTFQKRRSDVSMKASGGTTWPTERPFLDS